MADLSLTDKQARFCNEYLVDYNATQAAIRAGYSKKTASEQGYQQLHKTSVQEYLKSALSSQSQSFLAAFTALLFGVKQGISCICLISLPFSCQIDTVT